ncbi:MAG: hypothetical protein WC647_02255 [Desulfomonilaceae bacterium]
MRAILEAISFVVAPVIRLASDRCITFRFGQRTRVFIVVIYLLYACGTGQKAVTVRE